MDNFLLSPITGIYTEKYNGLIYDLSLENGHTYVAENVLVHNCDQTAGHYIKVLMDAVFGTDNFVNEIVWCYKAASGPSVRFFRRKHDTILFYGKTDAYRFYADAVRVEYGESVKQQIKSGTTSFGRVVEGNPLGKTPEDWWEIPIVNSMAKERLGYPTQKPELLLERIVKASSKEGDVVLDPFCGCGTTIAVAQRLNRQWIGIDITHIAIALIRHRLKEQFGDAVKYDVIGEPEDLESAKQLAADDPFQFQLWALGLDGARPTGGIKKGKDWGVDGRRYFSVGKHTGSIVYSVKSGHVSSRDVRDLRGTIEREDAAIGVLISLHPLTKDMKEEAAKGGTYEPPSLDGETFPRIQVLTVEELMGGQKKVQWPKYFKDATFKRTVGRKQEQE